MGNFFSPRLLFGRCSRMAGTEVFSTHCFSSPPTKGGKNKGTVRQTLERYKLLSILIFLMDF